MQLGGVRVTRSLVLYVCFVSFPLVIVLSVLLQYTDSDYPLVSSNSSYYYERVEDIIIDSRLLHKSEFLENLILT